MIENWKLKQKETVQGEHGSCTLMFPQPLTFCCLEVQLNCNRSNLMLNLAQNRTFLVGFLGVPVGAAWALQRLNIGVQIFSGNSSPKRSCAGCERC